MREPEGFREFVQARYPALVRLGALLTGDPGLGEDLVQSALMKTFRAWRRTPTARSAGQPGPRGPARAHLARRRPAQLGRTAMTDSDVTAVLDRTIDALSPRDPDPARSGRSRRGPVRPRR